MLQTVSFGDHLPAREPGSTLSPGREKNGDDDNNRNRSANLQVDLEGSLIYHGATSIYRAHSNEPIRGIASNEFPTPFTRHMSSNPNFEYVAEHFGIDLHDKLVDDALMHFFKWQYPHFMFIYRDLLWL